LSALEQDQCSRADKAETALSDAEITNENLRRSLAEQLEQTNTITIASNARAKAAEERAAALEARS
jgi:hypothetical protein